MSSKAQIIDEIGKLSVIELAELIKDLEEKFGVSAAMPVAAAAPTSAVGGADQAAAEEKSEYKVTLKEGGSEKLKVIKALRSVTSMALGDAKKAVEGVPFVVSEAASKEDAQKMKLVLEEAGAKVDLS